MRAELDRLRESLASLETVERAASDGRLRGHRLHRLGRRRAVRGRRGPRLPAGARLGPADTRASRSSSKGASAGEEREVTVTFPDDYQAEQLAGNEASFAVTVKEVKEKRLPELDDELAIEAGGFDSLAELREDVRSRLREAQEATIDREFREAAVDAVGGRREDRRPPRPRPREGARDVARRQRAASSSRASTPRRYLEMVGKTEEELVTESEPDAERALRREAVLAAVDRGRGHRGGRRRAARGAARGVRAEPGGQAAERQGAAPVAGKGARSVARDEALREDIAMRKAVDLIVDAAKPIPIEQAKAREELWTPEKEATPSPPSRSGHPAPEPSATPACGRRPVARISASGRNSSEQAKQSESNEPPGPDGRRADLSRRARVRHLFAAAERAHRVPRHAGHRRDRQPDRRAAPAPPVRGSGQGHLALHQLARRIRVRGPRDLRHDAVHQARRADDLRRHRDVDGRAAAVRAAPTASACRCPTRRS